MTPQHILVYPSPSAPGVGIQASGFAPFDDGMLAGTAGAPVHTEFLDRCKSSAVALLADRRQQALSLLQCETGATHAHMVGTSSDGPFLDLPVTRIYFPGAWPTVTLDLYVLADVSGGATADIVRVHQVGLGTTAQEVTFPADGTINHATLQLTVRQGDSGTALDRYADVCVGARTTAGHQTDLRAISGYYRPGA